MPAHSLPHGRPGRALALAILALLVVLVWSGAVLPLLQWHDERADALNRKAMIVHRMQAAADALPSLQALSKPVATFERPALLEGNTDAVSSASLLELAQDLASRDRVTVNSTEILPAVQRGEFRRIAVRVEAEGRQPEALARMEAEIERRKRAEP